MTDDQLRGVAPSIFAESAHTSRSERYTYITTSTVLDGLRKEGFQPFMVAQTRVRNEAKREHTKHMLRLRHASQINDREANEVILLNSHDGSSSYQMLAGMLRFVCKNGLVCGETVADIRVPHKGEIVDDVINGAFEVLDGFNLVRELRDGMRGVTLDSEEQLLRRIWLFPYQTLIADSANFAPRAGNICKARCANTRTAAIQGEMSICRVGTPRAGIRGLVKASFARHTDPITCECLLFFIFASLH